MRSYLIIVLFTMLNATDKGIQKSSMLLFCILEIHMPSVKLTAQQLIRNYYGVLFKEIYSIK